jgi:hypothetical protein
MNLPRADEDLSTTIQSSADVSSMANSTLLANAVRLMQLYAVTYVHQEQQRATVDQQQRMQGLAGELVLLELIRVKISYF